jgi:hypothetical protein
LNGLGLKSGSLRAADLTLVPENDHLVIARFTGERDAYPRPGPDRGWEREVG